ncbi:Ubiquitin-conjugating enzyme E2 [Sesbania bispinosa]|nr:Ubiquitin-conjugating enzyme E2 [Sesbania bispinosa]
MGGCWRERRSSRFMDPDVVEIPPPIHHSSRFKKQKQAILHNVIDIDNDDDSEDVVIIGEKVSRSNKGKAIEAVGEIESSNGHPVVSNNLFNVDGYGSDLSYDDDDYIDMFSEDYMDVDEYALLQAHFDNVDIPPGIEAPFTWLQEYDLGLQKTGNSTLDPWCNMQSDAKNNHVTDSAQPSWPLEPTNSKIQGSIMGTSNLQIKMDNVDHSSGAELSAELFSQAAFRKKKSAISQHSGSDLNLSMGVESSKPQWLSKMKSAFFGASKNHGLVDNPVAMKLLHAGKPSYLETLKGTKKAAGSSSSYHSDFIGHDGSLHPPGIESENLWWKNSHNFKPLLTNYNANPIYYPFDPLDPPPEHVLDSTWVHNSARDGNNGTAMDHPVLTIPDELKDEMLMKFRSFKQFDTVDDTSDHYYIRHSSSMKMHPKNWAKKIQEEWKILEKDLPDSIFVRVYESRMDLLRAVIIGAEGTPYHDGLFFFDVYFPSGYPNVPPLVHYHSGGLRLNPNLYNCGKVCLSLLNTWTGNKNEKWLPGVSTILQDFEDFVVGHFSSRAHDILVACKAYMEGAQVGCLVKGGVQDVDEGDKSCSKRFKESLAGYVKMLVTEFAKFGIKDCEKFLSPATTVNKPFCAGVTEATT